MSSITLSTAKIEEVSTMSDDTHALTLGYSGSIKDLIALAKKSEHPFDLTYVPNQLIIQVTGPKDKLLDILAEETQRRNW